MWQIEDNICSYWFFRVKKGSGCLGALLSRKRVRLDFKTKQALISPVDLAVKKSGLQGLGKLSMVLQVIKAELPYFSA